VIQNIPNYLLRDEITISRYLGRGAYGDLYAAAELVRAHVEPATRLDSAAASTLLPDTTGKTRTASLQVMFRPEVAPVPVESKVVWGGVEYRVLQVGAVPDEFRPSHRELLLGLG